MNTFRIFLFWLIVSLLTSQFVFARTENEASITHRINSEILKEERVVSVFLPAAYETSTDHYPVLVVLDGEDFARPFAGMVSYYSKIGKCPGLLVVGIDAADRWRDYTPTNAPIPDGTPLPTSGGAESFSGFIVNELMPYLESNYRISPFRVLFGHSIAGLFVINSVFEEQSDFSGYIATSPSLWWDNELMSSKAKGSSGLELSHSRYLFFDIGNEGPTMLDPILRFKDSMEGNTNNIFWEFEQFEGADHQTMPIKTFVYGLEFVFGDWQMPDSLYQGDLSRIVGYYDKLSAKYLQTIRPPETTINRLGYMALNQDKTDEALKIFQYNVELYPLSANAYDSLGEAYMKIGDSTNALKNYEKSLELNPENNNARNIIIELKAER